MPREAGRKNAPIKVGIYLETKPVDFPGVKQAGYRHSYLVYRKSDGTTEVLRGGPDDNWKLAVETGKNLEQSKDQYKPGEEPRPSQKLDIPENKLDESWGTMTQKAIVVGDARLDYLKGVVSEKKAQTSNSVVRAALDAIKYDHAKAFPDGELKDDFPGIDDNVDKDMDETWDRRLNPGNYGFDNPIDGEIGGTPTGDVPEQPPEPDPAKDDVKGASGADTLVADEGAKPVRRPEVQSFLEDVKTSDDPLADILLKPTGDWTEDEVGQVHRSDAYADPQQPDVAGKVRDWYERHYGTDPVQTDETGRTLEPVFTTVPKKEQVKAKGSDGQSVMEGVLGVGSKIADLADKRGLSTAIRGVQTGLNLLGQLQADDSTKSGPLETDGLFGAKTKRSFRNSIAERGAPKVENALALGSFQNLLEKKSGPARGNLGEVAHDSFSGLFQNDSPYKPADKSPTPWALVVQDTINDVGAKTFGKDAFKPLNSDGWIGPKTASAFDKLIKPTGMGGFMKILGNNFGFF